MNLKDIKIYTQNEGIFSQKLVIFFYKCRNNRKLEGLKFLKQHEHCRQIGKWRVENNEITKKC